MPVQILLPVLGTLCCYLIFHVIQFTYRDITSPLRDIVGPKSTNILLGHFGEMADDAYLTDKWRQQYGPNFQLRGLFNVRELHTSDLKALNHIFTNGTLYQKPEPVLANAVRLVGKGLVAVGRDDHKRQNPAFGISQIRGLTEVFVEKSLQLRDIWARQVSAGGSSAQIEVLSWLRRTTLDVIGQVRSCTKSVSRFNYQFNAMDTAGEPDELNDAFTQLFHSPSAQRNAGLRLAQSLVPILLLVPLPGVRALNYARAKIMAIGQQLVEKSKAAIKASQDDKLLSSGRRDLLSLLLKANLSTDIPDHQRLSNTEVISQIPTFCIAAHETTSSATAWALHALSQNQEVQGQLRDELLSISTDNPTMDELNALPYLESVVRETMRVYCPVTIAARKAMADDVLPLSKPYIDRKGTAHDSLPIAKGQIIHIPILAVNTDKELWGDDATEFIPARWEHLPDAVNSIPGIWAHQLTFLAGPHNCIGFRFSIAEMKALLFTLIRAFEFEPTCPKSGIARTATTTQRPIVVAEMEKGSQLPLIVKLYRAL
ncbi:cytochrome P450 [Mycena rebaudengoi]|nr:cytochrome P450 [Mycena rebaudengoi]